MYPSAPKKIQLIIDQIINVEGGYSDNPNDPGGPTKYGITEKVARLNGYEGDMQDLPIEFAQNVYYNQYVKAPKFNRVMDISSVSLASELIDSGVNCGTKRAGEWFQRSLNSFNIRGKLYPDLVVDGDIGPVSLRALQSFMEHRGSEGAIVLEKACNALQGAYYIGLGEANDKFEDFTYGWIRARV